MSEPTPAPKWKAIVAMASNRVIGRDGDLPWRLPEDLKWFKRLTMGNAIVMGRTTYESIGRPLPGRRNVVLSRSGFEAEGVEVCASVGELKALAFETDVYVIGGAKVYEALLETCEEVLLSYVFEPYEGDAFLLEFEDDFELVEVLLKTEDFELRRLVRRKRTTNGHES